MTRRAPLALTALAACAPLALALTAPAAQAATPTAKKAKRYAPVTATIPRGYRMAAVCPNGKVAVAGGRRVRLRPTCTTMTLHLITTKGVYRAPVVVGTQSGGRWAVTGVRAGTSLGTLRVRSGVAKPTRALSTSRTVAAFKARARKGNPIGARKLGLVRSRPSGRNTPGTDYDKDGLPGVFDVDDNGNMILDNFDQAGAAPRRSNQVTPPAAPGTPAAPGSPVGPGAPTGPTAPGTPSATPGASTQIRLFSNYKLDMGQSLNFNQGGLTQALIDSTMQQHQGLAIPVAGSGARLDCTGLTYCSYGGTGSVAGAPWPASPGYGLLTVGPTGDFQLQTGATSSQIRSGDVLTEVMPDGTRIGGMLNFVFGTTPALQAYSVNGGPAAAVAYPATVGTMANPIPVPAAGPVSVTMTYWRPQRAGIPATGEAAWMDIGRLNYSADVPNGPSASPGAPTPGPGRCAMSAYSTSDPDLSAVGDGLQDAQGDRAANPANTLTFTIDLTACLGATAWASGQSLQVDIQARSQYGDNAAQKIVFRRA